MYNITGTTNLYSIGNSFSSSANVQSVGTSVTINGGAVAFNSGEAISTDTFAINSSTLTGADNITVSGLTSLNSSSLSTTGTFNANGGMAINTGGGPGFIGKVTLNLSGNSTMSGPHSMGHGDNAVINILSGATLSIDDINFTRVTPADSTLNNQGTLRKITGTGSSTFDIILNNTGSIVVSSGSLSIRSGTSSGSASVSAPASLTASSYAFTSTSSVSGSGTMNLVSVTVDGVYNITGTTNLYSIGNSFGSSANVQSVGTSVTINGGAVAFNSGEAISTDTFAINSSTLTGADNITVSGLTSLNSSSLSTTGTFNANGGMAINTGGGPGFIGKVTLNLSGNSTMSGLHSMQHGDNAVINILSGASLSLEGNISFFRSTPSGSTINNQGSFRKTTGTGTSTVDAEMNNVGQVVVQNGTLSLPLVTQAAAGQLTGGGWNVDNGATLQFGGPAITTNSANVELSGSASLPPIASIQSNTGSFRLKDNASFTAAGNITTADN